MVWGVVNRHGAEIEIDSELARGTTVRIVFPAPPGALSESKPAEPPADSLMDLAHLNVLVADDDPLVRRMLNEMLKSCGHEVTSVDNGEDLIHRYEPGRYDVVITDRAMPRLNGDQAALEIKRRDPAQPVMMLTGFGALLQSADEHPEGVDLLLSKPVNLSSLVEALKKVHGRRPVAA
jgi:CheY-like chemotaxis protein